jgi:hypothetical protein
MFGGAIAKGEQQLGQGLTTAGKFYGQAAADAASNDFQDYASKLLYGDPAKTIIGPDGQPQPDLGFNGLKGRETLDQRGQVEAQIDAKLKSIRESLYTPESQLQFENFSRRYRTNISTQIGMHTDQQASVWYTQVNDASASLAKEHIANTAADDTQFLHGLEDLKQAYAKQADIGGGGPELKQAAIDRATREAYTTRIQTLGATDPVAAQKMADANKDKLGGAYPELHERLQVRADRQVSDEKADAAWKRSAGAALSSGAAEGAGGYGLINAPYRAPLDQKGERGIVSPAEHFSYLKSLGASNNEALTLTGAAGSESSFNAQAVHDNGNGYGLYGHNVGRLDLRGKDWQQQAQAALHELRGRPEGQMVNAATSPEQLAVAEMHFEEPRGYTSANPKGGDNYTGRLNTIRYFSQMANGVLSGAQGAPAPGRSPPQGVGAGPGGMQTLSPQAASLADRRSAAFDDIMNDPALTYEQRRGALANVEQQYSARTTEGSVEKQTLEQTVPNLIAAAENGVENINIPLDRINAVMPPAKAQLWKDEFEMAQQTGTAVKALRWSSPEDVAAMQRDIESGQGALSEAMKAHARGPSTGPGVTGANPDATENDAMHFRLRQGMARQFEAALARRQAMLVGPEADPAQYIADHPIAAKARAALDPNQPATYQAYAAAEIGLQQHVGAAEPQVLTKGQAERLAARWTAPDANGGATAVAADIQKQATLWGAYWPQVYRQIAPKANEMIRVIGAGVQPAAAKQLLEAQGVKDEDLLKGEDDPSTKRSDISKAVSDELKPFAASLVGSQRSQTLPDFQKVGERLAILRLEQSPGNASAAAKSAIDDILNFKYDYKDSFRVPRDTGVDPSVIQAGAVEAKRLLGDPDVLNAPSGLQSAGPLALAPKVDRHGRGLSEEYLKQETAESLRLDGKWVTDPKKESGLVLMQPDGYAARRPDGTPLLLTWGQLATLGRNQGQNRANNAAEEQQFTMPQMP